MDTATDFIRQIRTGIWANQYAKESDSSDSQPFRPLPTNSGFRGEILTKREFETLMLVERGLNKKEIAEKMFISPETVKSHVKNIYMKLEATGRREAVLRARALGILPPR